MFVGMNCIAGIDGARGGWVAYVWKEQVLVPLFAGSLKDLALQTGPCFWYIDMIIGMPGAQFAYRQCDLLARKALGKKAASLFHPPSRECIYNYESYAEANSATKAIHGKGLSIQSWNLRRKMMETDQFVQSGKADNYILREAHPELAFQQLNHGQSLHYSKKTPAGQDERLAILRNWHPMALQCLKAALNLCKKTLASPDDWADALALAINGIYRAGMIQPHPATTEVDEMGLPMQIWY